MKINFFVVAVLLSFTTYAQLSPVNTKIRYFNTVQLDSARFKPSDTTGSKTKGNVVYRDQDNIFYISDGFKFNPITGGNITVVNGGETTSGTVAQLRSLSTTTGRSYTATGPNGGPFTDIGPFDGQVVDDGAIYIVTTSNKILKRQITGDIDPRWFLASTSASSNTAAFAAAVTFASLTKSRVFVPSGVWKVDSIKVPDGVSLIGEGVASVITNAINDTSSSKRGIILAGNASKISNLSVQRFPIGIFSGETQQGEIERCFLFYNRVAIWAKDSYLNSIHNNYLTYNRAGIVSEGMSYQLLIKNNVIDNNEGIGIFINGTGGEIITDNSIEGNRNLANGLGVGLFINGSSPRTSIINNWFEVNDGVNQGLFNVNSTDILLTKFGSSPLQDSIIKYCIPKEFKSGTYWDCIGYYNIENNQHYVTKNGIVIGTSYGGVSIKGDAFTGAAGTFAKPIVLNFPGFADTKVDVDVNIYNSGNNSSGAEMQSGYKNSPIFGTLTNFVDVKYRGQSLTTYETTLEDFVTKFNATINPVITAVGSPVYLQNKKLKDYRGLNVVSTPPGNYITIGSIPNVSDTIYIVMLSDPNSSSLLSVTGGFAAFTNGPKTGSLNILKIPYSQINQPVLYAPEGSGYIYGYAVISKADYKAYMNLCTTVHITDWASFDDSSYITGNKLTDSLNARYASTEFTLKNATGTLDTLMTNPDSAHAYLKRIGIVGATKSVTSTSITYTITPPINGSLTFTGDGSTTSFTIPLNITGLQPTSRAFVQPKDTAVGAAIDHYELSTESITVYFLTAPTSGTKTLSYIVIP